METALEKTVWSWKIGCRSILQDKTSHKFIHLRENWNDIPKPVLYPHLSVEKNINLVCSKYSESGWKKQIKEIPVTVQLEGFEKLKS